MLHTVTLEHNDDAMLHTGVQVHNQDDAIPMLGNCYNGPNTNTDDVILHSGTATTSLHV